MSKERSSKRRPPRADMPAEFSFLDSKMIEQKKEKKLIKGKKQQMSQIFLETGEVVPVTIVVSEDELTDDLLNRSITVTGTSKGKGFTGVMKRWNFKGGPATRGQSNKPRAPGAIGSQTPGKVFKGKKMAGHMGDKTVTIKGLKIVKVFPEKGELFVSGPVPGARNSLLKLKFD